MRLRILAHGADGPQSWAELWTAWNGDALLWATLALVALVWSRGAARRRRRSELLFPIGLSVVAVALLSPLDALSGALASAHMVQHVLLVTVAAPLLAGARPMARLVRGLPTSARPVVRRARSAPPARAGHWLLGLPAVVALAHVAVLWAWHAPGPYEAAVEHPLLHAAEHLLFLGTAVAAWGAVLSRARNRAAAGVLVLFALSVQGALLGALLTFAQSPLYDSYATTTVAWGLTPLADQQLAGVIMWVPGGAVHLVVALVLLAGLLTDGGSGGVPARTAHVDVDDSDAPGPSLHAPTRRAG